MDMFYATSAWWILGKLRKAQAGSMEDAELIVTELGSEAFEQGQVVVNRSTKALAATIGDQISAAEASITNMAAKNMRPAMYTMGSWAKKK